MFVDATFDIVPSPFYQCLIIMVFDMSRRAYIPCAWVLMTGKTNECYWQVFSWLTSVVQDISPSYIGVDFEKAFFTNVAIHFPLAKLVGCFFHFKQAGRRKMKTLLFPDAEVKFAMKSGVYDLLTVIPVEHLHAGIDFVMETIEKFLIELYKDDAEACFNAKQRWWNFFEKYFQ